MPTDPLRPLSKWLEAPQRATLEPLGRASGMSGAQLWRVAIGDQRYVLRRWPGTAGSPCRIGGICGLQLHLADRGLPVPRPVLTLDGAIVYMFPDLKQPRETWGMSTWLPGVADYWSHPTPEKLQHAFMMLARIHQHAAEYPGEYNRPCQRIDASPSAQTRFERLCRLCEDGIAVLRHGLRNSDDGKDRAIANEAVALIERTMAPQRQAAAHWATVPLPLQWRLGDVWHDHVLFTGDRVTGVIDFGAAGIDSPAGDVARLLGSMVGDDRQRWRLGIDAYESICPMSDVERAAVDFFDASGTVTSAANWIQWLWPQDPAAFPFEGNRQAGVARLTRLVERLRRLPLRNG